MRYPATFTADEGGFIVSFRDIPEANTYGSDEAEAIEMAKDALLTAMDFYFEDRRSVPPPSAARKGERLVALPTSAAAKVLLLNEMLAQDVAPSELARRMGTTRQEVNRVIDLEHTTKIDRIQDALAALGRSLDLAVSDW